MTMKWTKKKNLIFCANFLWTKPVITSGFHACCMYLQGPTPSFASTNRLVYASRRCSLARISCGSGPAPEWFWSSPSLLAPPPWRVRSVRWVYHRVTLDTSGSLPLWNCPMVLMFTSLYLESRVSSSIDWSVPSAVMSDCWVQRVTVQHKSSVSKYN